MHATLLAIVFLALTPFQDADQRLNATYQRTLKAVPAAVQPKLVHAQLAWIAYRDADAAFRKRPEAAKTRLTEQRTGGLAGIEEAIAQGDDLEGILDAPNPTAMLEGARAQLAAADKLLNQRYKALMAKLDANGKQRLVASELKWIAFRDADAAVWTALRPKPDFASDRIFALGRSTQERADRLLAD